MCDTHYEAFMKPRSNINIARFSVQQVKQDSRESISAFRGGIKMILQECHYPWGQDGKHV